MIWPVINVICGLIVAAILTYKLTALVDRFTATDRAGMALIGAGMILTIGPILSSAPTPYEDWSGTLIRVGCVVYFGGRMLRHRLANIAAVRAARRHLRRKEGRAR